MQPLGPITAYCKQMGLTLMCPLEEIDILSIVFGVKSDSYSSVLQAQTDYTMLLHCGCEEYYSSWGAR